MRLISGLDRLSTQGSTDSLARYELIGPDDLGWDERYAPFPEADLIGSGGISQVYHLSPEKTGRDGIVTARKPIYLFSTQSPKPFGQRTIAPSLTPAHVKFDYDNEKDMLRVQVDGETYQATPNGLATTNDLRRKKDISNVGEVSFNLFKALNELYANANAGSAGIPQVPRFLGHQYVTDQNGDFFLLLDMEHIPGQSVEERAEYIKEQQGESRYKQFIGSMLEQQIQGVHYIHQRGIVHRDLKSNNFLVTGNFNGPIEGNKLYIIDFGIARVFDQSTKSFRALKPSLQKFLTTHRPEWEAACGTPGSMAPEQVSAQKLKNEEVDKESDYFSLGLNTVWMVGGVSEGTYIDTLTNSTLDQSIAQLLRYNLDSRDQIVREMDVSAYTPLQAHALQNGVANLLHPIPQQRSLDALFHAARLLQSETRL